jgi:hypothetical protein
VNDKNIQKIIFIIFAFFWIIFIAKGQDAKAATASTTQELTLVILTAVEMHLDPLGQASYSATKLEQPYQLRIRANTNWQVSFSVDSSFSQAPVFPSTIKGARNRDNSYQVYGATLQQPLSWADNGNESIAISYSLSPSL